MNQTAKKSLLFAIALSVLASTYRLVGELTLERSKNLSLATPLDDAMPIIPELTVIYMTIYCMWLPLIFSQNISCAYFKKIIAATFVAFGILYIFYFLMPSSYPRPAMTDCNCWRHSPLRFLYDMDLPNNTFPSSHAAGVAILLLATFGKFKTAGLIFYQIWGLTIIFSTFAIKQHYILDAACGAGIGAIVFIIINKCPRLISSKNPA